MKLIKSVEVIEVSNNPYDIIHPPQSSMYAYNRDAESQAMKLYREVVRGQHFINDKGEDVVIGMCEEVQKLIGLPFDSYDALSKEIIDATTKLHDEESKRKRLNLMIEELMGVGLWMRIKFLFTRRMEGVWKELL
tara:strand:- start:1523 stop:1927 length:405 start_codon:yes stop_codon:yes gene_type:complete